MKQLDGRTMVAGQIAVEEVAELGRDGVTMIVNNRPDGEDAGQPTSAEMQAAMRDVGDGQMVAYCRSGMRSALAWALARRAEGDPRETIEAAAERAGIDLAPIAHLL